MYRSSAGRPQTAEVAGLPAEGVVVLRILDKMGRGKEPEPGSVPVKGDAVCCTLFEHDQRGGAKLPAPEDTPWTHGGPPGAQAAAGTADAADAAVTADHTVTGVTGLTAVAESADPFTEEDVL